jgi:tetratricopeptide (TPR) repeat protein
LQQLDALRTVRQKVRGELLAEGKKHPAWKRLCQIPSIGPIRSAVLLGILQTPHRFRTKRQLWAYSEFGIETQSSADHRSVDGRLQRAKKQRKPDCEGSWNILRRAFFASGRHEEAAALTERALEANGDDYNTYIPFANVLERLGRKKEAEHVRERMSKILRQQLELVPEDVRARILLAANIAHLAQDADESIRHLQTAVALRPGDSNTLYS